jgi:hypothetical protein
MQSIKFNRSALSVVMSVAALATVTGCGSADTAGGGQGAGAASKSDTTSVASNGSGSGVAAPKVFDNEADFNLLAEVSVEGRTVKFFEPETGVLLEVEKGADGAPRAPEEAGLSGVALYEFLANAPAPQALVDAEKRATASNDDHSQDHADTDLLAAKQQQKTNWSEINAGDSGSFRSRFCQATDRYYERLGYTGQTYIHTTGTNMMQAGVYSYDDLINYHGSYSGGGLLWDTGLPAGWYLGWRVTSSVNRTAHSEVNSSPWAGYDHCVNYHY